MSSEAHRMGLVAKLASLRTTLERIVTVLIQIILGAMVLLVFANVISRYFLNFAIAWSAEVSRFLLIWMVFLGAYVAFVHNEHLGLDVVVQHLPRRAAKIVVVLADLLVLGALAVMLDGAIGVAVDSFASGWVSPAVSLPYGFVYLVGPISAALMILQAVLKTYDDVRSLVRRTEEESRA